MHTCICNGKVVQCARVCVRVHEYYCMGITLCFMSNAIPLHVFEWEVEKRVAAIGYTAAWLRMVILYMDFIVRNYYFVWAQEN